MIDVANEAGAFDGDIVIVKPIAFGSLERFQKQECQYTVSLRGIVDGKPSVSNRLVTSVTDAVGAYEAYETYSELAKLDTLRFVVSNTTEAGIVYDPDDRLEFCPPRSFPGKLTKFLYERFCFFAGAEDKGLILLPVELIDDNGIHLKACVLRLANDWNLGSEFVQWVEKNCVFCSTLVDRIITGYPKEEEGTLWEQFGYRDELIVTGEPFALWVIESERDISEELPLDRAGLPVLFTKDQKPYKQRKVRILNGAHTSFVLASYLAGNNSVLESMEDDLIRTFMLRTIYDEIIPTLTLPEEELKQFAEAVVVRFQNPYVKHALLSIALNSVSKWRARCMPSLLGYVKKYGDLPKRLTFSLAALIAFYRGSEMREKALIGHRGEEEYKILDDEAVLQFFADNSQKPADELVTAFLKQENIWGQNLTEVAGLCEMVSSALEDIYSFGMREAIKKQCKD